MDDPVQEWIAAYRRERDRRIAVETRLIEVTAAMKEIIRISDRKHDAWDRAKAVLYAPILFAPTSRDAGSEESGDSA